MLRGFMTNSNEVLCNILNFCVWKEYLSCEDEDEVNSRLGIKMGSKSLEEGKRLYNRYANDGFPWTGMRKELYWSYYEKFRDDFDKVTLLAFLAIKSYLGKNKYYKLSNQSNLFKRMSGYKESDKIKIPKEIAVFTTRYRFDKIKLELKENWKVIFYATHIRGMYFSISMTLDELVLQAEKNKLKSRQKMQTKAVEEARKRALEELKKYI